MDSCSSIILDKLKSMGSMVIETPDQDHSDYTKALIQLGQYAKAENINVMLDFIETLFKRIAPNN